MKTLPGLLTLLVVAVAGTGVQWALPPSQETSEKPQASAAKPEVSIPTESPAKFRVDATLVNLDVLVTDEDGRVLTGLKRGNFRVLDNGVPQTVLDFAPTAAPITIVLLMEYNSATYGYFAQKAAEWATGFLNHLEPKDWVALITFDLKPAVQVDFTHKRFEVRSALETLGVPLFSEANLFDSLIDTLDKLEGVPGKKSILLIATGANSFSAATLDEVSERLKRTDVTIFCVGLAEGEYLRNRGNNNISYLQSKNWLTSFAKQTGGLALFPRFQGELPEIFRSVVGFQRGEYNLTFRPPKENRDGRYHRVKVEIVGADGKPLKVTDEKGRRRKVEVFARQGYVAPLEKTP